MGLFEQFPFTDFHGLNLDWLINEIKKQGEHAVLSVNGQTGDVVLYKSENIVFPEVTANTWRMVRVADGHTAGIMLQNGLLYVMFDNTAERVYTVDHPPTYPVTSVDGQTGAVQVFPNAATRLPDVTEDYTNIRRQIRTNNADNIVGIELKADKAYRMKDSARKQLYDEENQPPYPVTSVNGQTGAIVIAVPFEDVDLPGLTFSEPSDEHYWSLGRETLDGIASIQLETDSSGAAAYLRFFTEDDPPVSFVKKLLTTDDIPDSSGVVSINGQTGVVTVYGDTIPYTSGSPISMKEYADNLSGCVAYVETTNTAVNAIAAGEFVVWKGVLYKASTDIEIGDSLSVSNLDSVTGGGLNELQAITSGQITPISSSVTITQDAVYKINNVIYIPRITFAISGNLGSGWQVVANMPVGFAPAHINQLVIVNDNTVDPNTGYGMISQIRINTDGTIEVWNPKNNMNLWGGGYTLL